MKEDSHNHSIDPELEARIVALVLGEASDFERDKLNRLINERPELEAFKAQLQSVHGLLRDIGSGDPLAEDEAWKLPPEKRNTVLAAIRGESVEVGIKQPATNEPHTRRFAKTRLFWQLTRIAAVLCIALSAGTLAFFSIRSPHVRVGSSQVTDSEAATETESQWQNGAYSNDLGLATDSNLLGENLAPIAPATDVEFAIKESSTAALSGIRDSNTNDLKSLNLADDVQYFDDRPGTPPTRPPLETQSREATQTSQPTTDENSVLSRRESTRSAGGAGLGFPSTGFEGGREIRSGQMGGGQMGGGGGTLQSPHFAATPGSDRPSDRYDDAFGSNLNVPEQRAAESVNGRFGKGIEQKQSGRTRTPNTHTIERSQLADGTPDEFHVLDGFGRTSEDSGTQDFSAGGLESAESDFAVDRKSANQDRRYEIVDQEKEVDSQLVDEESLPSLTPSSSFDTPVANPSIGFSHHRSLSVPDQSGNEAALEEEVTSGFEGVDIADGEELGEDYFKRESGVGGGFAGRLVENVPRDNPAEPSDEHLFDFDADPERAATNGSSRTDRPTVAQEEFEHANDYSESVRVPETISKKSREVRKNDSSLTDNRRNADGGFYYHQDLPDPYYQVLPADPGADRSVDLYQRVPTQSFEESGEIESRAKHSLGQIAELHKLGTELGIVDESLPARGEGIDRFWGRPQSKFSAGVQSQVPESGSRIEIAGKVRRDYSGPSTKAFADSAKNFGLQKTASPEGIDEVSAVEQAFSTFSLHVSDVSFKLALASLSNGEWPESARIRIEEFVNAFDYGDPLPSQNEKVACNLEQSIHPFLQQRNILRVSMRTAAVGRSSDTPLRLTFLLDNSGSMERSDRRQTVRRAFALLIQQLKPTDQVTLISFARQPRLMADKVNGAQLKQLDQLIQDLPSEGGTNIEAALKLGFEKAREQQVAGAQNRVILLTDGAVNLGNAKPDSLAKMIVTMRDAGISFDAAGISADGLNDEILEALTRQGDGRYYLLDSVEDADDGFARQIAGALRPSAKNVKVQVEFNPKRVGHYKLLGFEKHRLQKEDFRNDKVDAAEMAAAEAGVGVYQFEAKPDGAGDVGSVSVRFRDLSTGEMVEHCWPIPYEPDAPRPEQAAPSLRIATSAALLAAKLRGEPLGESVDLKTLSNLVSSLPDQERNADRVRQLQMMIERARQISGN